MSSLRWSEKGKRGTLHCISCYELSVNWVEIEDISTTLETHSMENGGDVAPDKPWYQLGQVSSSHHRTLSSRFKRQFEHQHDDDNADYDDDDDDNDDEDDDDDYDKDDIG